MSIAKIAMPQKLPGESGQPPKRTRLTVGVHYLKHAFALSDEQVVERWIEDPYWQYFCGIPHFQHLHKLLGA